VVTSSKPVDGAPPLVSIGLPVYNGEMDIARALDCLLAQTFANFELIIADNASTDGTERICRAYAARDSRIRYVRHAQNLGAIANFSFVLQEAVGDYFMWAAADDERAPDCVAFYLAHIGSAGGVFSTYAVRDRATGVDALTAVPVLSGRRNSADDIKRFLEQPTPSMIYGFFRRDVALKCYSSAVFDWADCSFVLKVMQLAGFVSVVSEPKYFAGIRGEYVLKPFNRRFFNPVPHFVRSFPVALGAGPVALYVHCKIFVAAVRLNWALRQQRRAAKSA
jgi:glycosyltransferase involved in cell wall biosynthesis